MSCSYYTTIYRDINSEDHQNKVRALAALIKAKVSELPKELAEYFGNSDAHDAYVERNECLRIETIYVESSQSTDPPYIERVKRDYASVLRISVKELPEDVAFIDVTIGC